MVVPAAAAEPFQTLMTADSLALAGQPDRALALGRRVLVEYSQATASDTALGWIEHRLGNYHFALGDLDSARVYWTRAAITYEKYGASPLKRIGVQSNLAVLESMSGRTVRAAFAFEEALRLHREAGTDSTLDGANVMNNLALMYDELGRSDEALALFDESGSVWRKRLGENDWKVGLNIGNRGIVYARRGQDGLAEYCFRESVRIIQASLGADHARLAEPEGNLAAILVSRGRFDEAEKLYQDALRVIELGVGDIHPDLIARLNGLGTLYRERGEAAAAEAAYRRALAIAEANGGDTSLATADQLHHLALALSDQGRQLEADSLWNRAERIYESQGRAQSYEMLTIAQARMTRAQTRAAQDAYRFRVLALTDSLYRGTAHPARGSALLSLAEVDCRNFQWSAAVPMAETALSICLELLSRNARYLNERDALTAGAQLRTAVDLCLTALLAGRPTDAPADVHSGLAEKLTASKGLIFELLSARTRAGADYRDSEWGKLRAEYDAARVALAGQFARPDSWSLAGDRSTADSVGRLADSLETRLAVEFGQRMASPVMEFHLGEFFARNPGTLVVQYFRVAFPMGGHRSGEHYVAMTFSESLQAKAVDLGLASTVDSGVAAYREHMLERARRPGLAGPEDLTAYRKIAGSLRTQIWDPVVGCLGVDKPWTGDRGEPVCMVVADGQLGLVSLGTLPDATGAYLADAFRFRYLSSLRDGDTQNRNVSTPAHGLLAIGDPAFDSLTASEEDLVSTGLALRSADLDCSFQTGRPMVRLPLSRWEVEQVAADWNRSHADSAVVLLGSRASEASLRAGARGKRALHIATHGYYLDLGCGSMRPVALHKAHPLLLSGLLLAGSNRQEQTLPAERDGILSAYEVSALDLGGTETVVLSACESGIGAAVQSEGLYGLRHAFRLAGVRTVVCSLWPVSDRYTAAFMSRLYDAGAESVALRLDTVQREERERLRREGLADHPLTWGAFIAFGSVD